MLHRIKKFIIVLTFFMVILFLSLFYLFSYTPKQHQVYCAQYIPLLKSYHIQHHTYPSDLDIFEKNIIDQRYQPDVCGYSTNNITYAFMIHDRMGVIGYDSTDKQWWYD